MCIRSNKIVNAELQNILKENSEAGAALILYVVISAILLGFISWSTLALTKSSSVMAYQTSNMNQARTAAMIGVYALKQTISAATASSASSNALLGAQLSTTLNHTKPYLKANVLATINNVTSVGNSTYYTVLSQGSSGMANASLVALISNGSGTGAGNNGFNFPVNLTGNTTFSGSINLIGNSSGKLINKGEISSSGSFSGFNLVAATKSISLSGSSRSGNLFSNEDITVTGSGSYTSIKSLGNINMASSTHAENTQSNGSTTLGSSSSVNGTLTSIGNVTLSSSATVGSLFTDGSVSAQGSGISKAQIEGNYSQQYGSSFPTGNFGGTITYPSYMTNSTLIHTNNLQVPITPLTALTVSTPSIDASSLESQANFAFTPPPTGAANTIVATVQVENVNGITGGTYYLYDNGKYNDYLCTSSNPSYSTSGGLPSGCNVKIAQGYSGYNPAISFSSPGNSGSTGTWQIESNGSDSGIVPGVVWFQGNVNVADGTYYNSIIATGTITTAGSSQVYAVNYAYGVGMDVCSNTGYKDGSITVSPENFCGSGSSSSYTPNSTGNIALLAGDDVSLGASNSVYGDVLAGDVISTSGSTTIHGFIYSAGVDGGTNNFGASTTVDISKLPSTFVPGNAPGISPPASGSSNTTLLSLYWK